MRIMEEDKHRYYSEHRTTGCAQKSTQQNPMTKGHLEKLPYFFRRLNGVRIVASEPGAWQPLPVGSEGMNRAQRLRRQRRIVFEYLRFRPARRVEAEQELDRQAGSPHDRLADQDLRIVMDVRLPVYLATLSPAKWRRF